MIKNESIYNSIKKCYPEDVDQLYQEILSKINTFNTNQTKKQHQSLEEINAILITYADTLRGEGSPLSVLKDFLSEYVQSSFNTVHLLPFFPYSSDDGFSVIDYQSINPDCGDWQDIWELSKHYKLMFDGVINHISQKSDWFQAYLNGENDFKDYFIEMEEDEDLCQVTRPRATPLLTIFNTKLGKKRVWTTFSSDQIDLNFKNPNVFLKIIDILLFYIKNGATLIRLDAIGYLWKIPGTCCIHLEQTHEMVKLFRSVLDSLKKNALIITETNVPHLENISYFGEGVDEAHMVYNFSLPPLILHAYLQKSSHDLNKWAEDLAYPGPNASYFNFLASHDGIGLMPLKGLVEDRDIDRLVKRCQENGGRVSYKSNEDGTHTPYELNINYFNAISEKYLSQEENIRKFLGAYSIALALKGIPGVYIHSLIGSVNWEDGVDILAHNRAINREKVDVAVLISELKNEDSRRHKIFFGLKELLNIRNTQKALSLNATQKVIKYDERLFIIERMLDDERIIVLINLTEMPVPINLYELEGFEYCRDLVADKKYEEKMILEGYGYCWLKKDRGVTNER